MGLPASVKRALYIAEVENEGPVYLVDIYRAWLKISYFLLRGHFVVLGVLTDLYKNDEILADEKWEKFSLNP